MLILLSQEAGQVVWYSHVLKNFPQFIVIHIVKGFGIVNKAKVDVFLELSCFFDDPSNVGNLISGSSALSKTSLNIWKFTVHVLLKPGLENFKHYFTSMWDECNWLIAKDPDAGRDWGQKEKGMTEDEMAGWHHRLNADEFGWTLGVRDGQGGLACCDSWGGKESDTTERLNWTESCFTGKEWIGQKVCSSFSATSYRKTQTYFLANPVIGIFGFLG